MEQELIKQMNKIPLNFWQANFWGIIGTITGVIGTFTGLGGLIISWINFKYNTPKIEIDKMYLVIPNGIVRDWKGKTQNDLKSSFLDFELEIIVRNKRGGPGSIDKPNLILGIPQKFLHFFNKERFIIIPPITEHGESEKESENVTKVWTERHGRSFNLGGGEKVDEKLEYETYNSEFIFEIVNNFEKIKYYIEYSDNYGKHYKKMISKVYNETDRDE